MALENTAWQLEDFVDSLVIELDKTRDTLAIKAINKPLSYTVKDLSLDLNIFPSYDGDQVRFVTAQPGQQGASKVTIQLGSITDQQVRATTKPPPAKNDIKIDEIDVDKATKKQLRKLGVNSVDDLEHIDRKNISLGTGPDSTIDYRKLAAQIQKSRRNQNPPRVKAVSLSVDDDQAPCLLIEGENLAVDPAFPPVVVINQRLAEVTASNGRTVQVRITDEFDLSESNEVILTFDPFAVARVNVKGRGSAP
jgi:hypothetical protein